MLIEEIKKELSEITAKIEGLSSEDEELVKWKLADFKKDVLQTRYYINDIMNTLVIHKNSIDNK
jgi:hypothetical protein